jgi:hypothetical protein
MKRTRHSPDALSASSYISLKTTFKNNTKLTSNASNMSVFDFVTSWSNDNDIDDLYDLYLSSGNTKLDLDFRIINSLCLFLQYPNVSSKRLPKHIQTHLDYIQDNNLSKQEIISKHIENINTLYHAIFQFPMSSLYMKPNRKITLYRGFRHNIEPKQNITTNMFLSTSISKNSALRFTKQNNVLWKINITPKYFDIFPYVYFDTYIKLPYEKQSEAEFLLNIGCMLSLKNTQKNITETIQVYTMDTNLNLTSQPKSITYDLHEYNFTGWDNNTLSTINNNFNTYSKYGLSPKN